MSMDAKVLRRAAELIDQGWCQGALAKTGTGMMLGDPESPLAARWCVTGAFIRARAELDAHGTTAFLKVMAETAPNPAQWNNAPGRTADEVAAALRAAADRCETP